MSFGGGGSSSAPDTSTPIIAATNQSSALLEKMFNEASNRSVDWVNQGRTAVNYLGGMLTPDASGNFRYDPTETLRSTPGYQWTMDQGVKARDYSAAKRGGLLSGAHQKGLTTFGQGLADTTYQSYLNNLFNLSSQGLGATNSINSLGMNYANSAGSNYLTAGQAQAQQAMNNYNAKQAAKQSGYNSLGSLLGMGAGILAAPFTGGTSLIGSGVSALGGLFGGGGSSVGSSSFYDNMYSGGGL